MERLNQLATLISRKLFIDQKLESITYTDESKSKVIIRISKWLQDETGGEWKAGTIVLKTEDAFDKFKGK